MKDEEEILEDKLQSRKKQFHVLVNSIHRLQDLIDQEEEATDAMAASVHSVNMAKEEGLVESGDEDDGGEDFDEIGIDPEEDTYVRDIFIMKYFS